MKGETTGVAFMEVITLKAYLHIFHSSFIRYDIVDINKLPPPRLCLKAKWAYDTLLRSAREYRLSFVGMNCLNALG